MEWLPTPVFLPRKSHGYTYIHSLLSFNPPAPSHPSRWSQNTSWAPCVIQHLPNICFSHAHVYMVMLLPQLVLPSLSPPFSINLLLTPLILIAVFCLAKELLSTSNLLVVVIHCSVTQLCLTLWDPMDCSTPDFPVPYHLPEFAQVHVHWISDAIQLSHPLSPSSPPALTLSQHQGLFQWPINQSLASGGQSTRASVSASVLPKSAQDWLNLLDEMANHSKVTAS